MGGFIGLKRKKRVLPESEFIEIGFSSDLLHSVSEASKFVMSYIAAVCGKGQEVNKVKEQLLQSNPVLEGE